MKTSVLSLSIAFGIIAAAQAEDVSMKLTEVYLCFGQCENGVKRAVAKVKGMTAVTDKDAETVTLYGRD